MLKKFFIFLLCLLPWFLASLFPLDYNFYSSLNLPFFAPPRIFYGIVWPIVYVLIALNISSLLWNYKFKDIPLSYKITLLVNYLFNQGYTLFEWKVSRFGAFHLNYIFLKRKKK